jgi:hypothetical protein
MSTRAKEQEGNDMNPLPIKKLAAWVLGAFLSSVAAFGGSPTVLVTGTVTDDSGHGWPLYARVEFTSESTDPLVVYSDPVTGDYTANLQDATEYTVVVTAVGPGYARGGGVLVTGGSPIDADWALEASALCDAPGYGAGTYGPPVLSESFDGGVLPPGWSIQTDSGVSWIVMDGADPCGFFEGNRTGGSGPFAIVNSNCAFSFDDTYLVTPVVDLSGSANAAIRWANDFIASGFGDLAEVDVTIDGGTTWTNVWKGPASGLPGPGIQTADMSFAAGHAAVQARFHYQWFFGFWWQVDDVTIGPFSCPVLPGGLVVGSVTDANTGLGLNGATVTNLTDDTSATTAGAPEQGDGFYSLFAAGSGSQDFEASADLHTSLTKNATVVADAAVRLDFSLAAGILSANPRPLSAVVSPGGTATQTLDVTNTGTGDGTFFLHEIDVPPPAPTEPVFASLDIVRAARRAFPTAGFSGVGAKPTGPLPNAPTLVPRSPAGAGNFVSSFESGLAAGWAVAYDTDVDRLWLPNPDAPIPGLPGDGFDYQFQPNGTQTGETIDLQLPNVWLGDGTYNARTGMMWHPDVAYRAGNPQCLVEIDPVAKAVTGKTICGPWTDYPGLVGLAYDYSTDTFYAGDQLGTIYHIDGAGNLLDSGNIGVQVSGLAFNPTTRHLFVTAFQFVPFDMYIVSPDDGYAVLSGFNVQSAGEPVLNLRGVSLEADCDGHLWVMHVDTKVVLEVESGERGWCVGDIPWLSEDPMSATIPGTGGGSVAAGGGNTQPVNVTFDSAGLFPGLYRRTLVFTTDTPDPVAPVPVEFTVLFADVPEGSFAWNYIVGAAGAGVMPGCNPYAPAYAFCPNEIVTRRSMAGYIERAVHGALTPPPVYTGEFDDVLLGSFNADYIQGLVDDHITAGCSVEPRLYCPDVPVTRAQMAVFVWKAQHGEEAPEPCTGVFADVPCTSPYADYIEGIASEGITVGCGGGNYCPNAGITNAQMAVYLVKAFELPFIPVP